jgi:hypothetical protein
VADVLFDVPSLAVKSDAVLSVCGTYRYRLTRQWDASLPPLGWVMLNPSTADHRHDDPTVRRCMAFARRWGLGGVVIRNLFALRATDPGELTRCSDPLGPLNSAELAEAAAEPLTVLAWGAGAPLELGAHVSSAIAAQCRRRGTSLAVLGWTKSRAPRHPLYVRADTVAEFIIDAR